MHQTKRLSGVCTECGGPIQFPAELIGTTAQCPRCRKQTELGLAVPTIEPALPRRVVVYTVVGTVILVAALITTVVALKHYESLAASKKASAAAAAGTNDIAAPAGLEVSAVSLEKGQSTDGAYAIGTMVNISGKPRSRITVEFHLLDAEGRTVEVARAFRPVLEPGAKWEIKVAAAPDSKAVSTKVASVKAGQ